MDAKDEIKILTLITKFHVPHDLVSGYLCQASELAASPVGRLNHVTTGTPEVLLSFLSYTFTRCSLKEENMFI